MTDQGVHRLIRSFASLETIVDLMCPRTHLDCANEVGVDDSLGVEAWEKRGEMFPNEVGLGANG